MIQFSLRKLEKPKLKIAALVSGVIPHQDQWYGDLGFRVVRPAP